MKRSHMGNFRVIRRKIRQRIKEALANGLNINRFSARTAALSEGELPAALIYFPSERIIEPSGESQERELELRVEVALRPQADPDDEVFALADEVEEVLLSDDGIEQLVSAIDWESTVFLVDGEGDDIIAAAQQTFKLRYLSEEPAP